jgi:hypothetical protein
MVVSFSCKNYWQAVREFLLNQPGRLPAGQSKMVFKRSASRFLNIYIRL